MTEPRNTQREQEPAAAAERDPEVNPEVIGDLDALAEDADDVRGGDGTCGGAEIKFTIHIRS